MEQIKQRLIKLGFTNKEALIYLDIFTNGNDTVNSISASTGINRITVHSAVEQLIIKDFVYESREGRKRKLFANPPEQFVDLVRQKQHSLNLMFDNATALVDLFKNIPQSKHSVPIIRVYKGVNGLKKLLEETLSSKGLIRVIIDIEQFKEHLTEEYLLDYYKKRAARGIRSKLIWSESQFAKQISKTKDEYKIEVKTIKDSKNWKVGIFSWDDNLGIKSLTRGNLVCTVIKSREIADFYQKILFDTVWKNVD
jgi:sugar-specific transcriptional regulator TrmB